MAARGRQSGMPLQVDGSPGDGASMLDRRAGREGLRHPSSAFTRLGADWSRLGALWVWVALTFLAFPFPVQAMPASQAETCACDADRYSCSDFPSWIQAQECYAYCLVTVGFDIHRLDEDGDGVVCELPLLLPTATPASLSEAPAVPSPTLSVSPPLTPVTSITATQALTPVQPVTAAQDLTPPPAPPGNRVAWQEVAPYGLGAAGIVALLLVFWFLRIRRVSQGGDPDGGGPPEHQATTRLP